MASLCLQLRWEFHKLFARPRTWLGFAAFLVFELLLIALMHHGAVREEMRRSIVRLGFTFPENFTGPTIAEFVMGNTMTILGNLYVAMTTGEIVAREIGDGTMRMLLCRPIDRRWVLALKLLTSIVFTGIVTSFITVTALAFGLIYKGPGYWLIFSAKEQLVAHFEFWPGMARYFIATAFMTLSVCAITTLAFLLSCLRAKPATAAIGSLCFFIVDDTLRNLPFLAAIKPHFVMTHVVGWLHIYDRRIPWDFMLRNSAWLLALEGAFVAAGWITFMRRDLKP